MSEPHYTAAEKARLAALVARSVAAVSRGKSTTRIDSTIEKIRGTATLRDALIEEKHANQRTKRAAEKAERQAGRWFR